MEVRIAHLADTHLGFRQYNLEERENDVYDAFKEAIERAIEERADVLILAGDTFDSASPPVKALHVFKEAMREIESRRSGMKVLAVLGDHDIPKRRGMPPHRLFDVDVLGVHGIECVEVKGVLFGGISNLKGRYIGALKSEISKFERIAERFNGASVLIAHQAIQRFLPFEGAYELHENDLPKNVSYYAFGHIHARASMRFGNGILAYAGSTEIMRRDEISSWRRNGKGFFIVDLNGKEEPTLHKINLNTIRPQIEMEINEEDVHSLNIPESEKKPVLHISIVGDRHINKQEIMKTLDKLLEGKVLRCRYAFKEREAMRNISISEENLSIRDIFASFLRDDLVELAESLYHALSKDDVKSAIELAEEFFETKWRENQQSTHSTEMKSMKEKGKPEPEAEKAEENKGGDVKGVAMARAESESEEANHVSRISRISQSRIADISIREQDIRNTEIKDAREKIKREKKRRVRRRSDVEAVLKMWW